MTERILRLHSNETERQRFERVPAFLQKISISSIYINYIKNGYFGIVPYWSELSCNMRLKFEVDNIIIKALSPNNLGMGLEEEIIC